MFGQWWTLYHKLERHNRYFAVTRKTRRVSVAWSATKRRWCFLVATAFAERRDAVAQVHRASRAVTLAAATSACSPPLVLKSSLARSPAIVPHDTFSRRRVQGSGASRRPARSPSLADMPPVRIGGLDRHSSLPKFTIVYGRAPSFLLGTCWHSRSSHGLLSSPERQKT